MKRNMTQEHTRLFLEIQYEPPITASRRNVSLSKHMLLQMSQLYLPRACPTQPGWILNVCGYKSRPDGDTFTRATVRAGFDADAAGPFIIEDAQGMDGALAISSCSRLERD